MNSTATGADESFLLSPTIQNERIGSLDVVRGFALLGILVVNIQGVAMITATYQNPISFGPLEGWGYWVWWLMHVFFELKMMSIFSMLFGAGIVLGAERASRKSSGAAGFHYRRMSWLLLIGLAHAYLIWYGDILVCYSLCGMAILWMRNKSPFVLFVVGLLILSIPSLLKSFFAYGFQYMPEADIAQLNADWHPDDEHVQQELAAYRGTWLEQMPTRAKTAFMLQTFVNLILFFWRAGGLMLIGMALYKISFFNATKSNKLYLLLAVIGGVLGWSLVLWGVERNEAANWEVTYSLATGSQFNYWGSICVALAYVCMILLWFKAGWLGWLQKALRAVGQMALTNYLMQSLLMTYICWGHGLGWVGQLSRLEQMAIVVGIWIFQLLISPVWLQYFRFGPCEWLWRSLSYWRLQPFRRNAGARDLPA